MREFCELDMPVIMLDVKGDATVKTMEQVSGGGFSGNAVRELLRLMWMVVDQLLPMSFGPEHLLREIRKGKEKEEGGEDV